MKAIYTILLIITFSQIAWARDIIPSSSSSRGSCNDVIKECLAFIGSKRLLCFENASRSPNCSRSLYKKILSLRTGNVDEKLEDLVDGKLLDQRCVELFDGQLSSVIAKNSQNISEFQSLLESITQCWVNVPMDITK